MKHKRAQRATFLNLTFHQNTRTQEARAASKAGPQRCDSQHRRCVALKIEQVTFRPVTSARAEVKAASALTTRGNGEDQR